MHTTEDQRPGAVLLGRYRLERIVGHGGMGVVWAAVDLETDEPRAVKLVHANRISDLSSHTRLIREARATMSIRHPNIARVLDVCELADGQPFIVMELLLGESLATRLRRKRKLSIGETARVLRDVCDAVMAAHARGIIHRDLKPDNVFLQVSSEGETTKVLDFGLAKKIHTADESEASLTTTGGILGTPHYMAPEQIFGDEDVDERVDAWAIGIMLHECLTGRRPTQGAGLGQVLKIIATGAIPPLDVEVPEEIGDLADRLLRVPREERPSLARVKEILSRYTNIEEEAVAVQSPSTVTLDTGEIRAPEESIGGTTSKKVRLRRVGSGALAIVSALAIGTIVVQAVVSRPDITTTPATASTHVDPPVTNETRDAAELAVDVLVIPAPQPSTIVSSKKPIVASTAVQTTKDASAIVDATAIEAHKDGGFDLPLSAVRH